LIDVASEKRSIATRLISADVVETLDDVASEIRDYMYFRNATSVATRLVSAGIV
jgi:hypothetical protein